MTMKIFGVTSCAFISSFSKTVDGNNMEILWKKHSLSSCLKANFGLDFLGCWKLKLTCIGSGCL